MNDENKKELIHTGTIGAVGLGTGLLAAKIGHMFPNKIGRSVMAAGAVSGALGLAGDYGAVKLMKKTDQHLSKSASNKYLQKIASDTRNK